MATEILRPNAAGDETNIPTTGGMGTGHWGRVSDEDDATYLANHNNVWLRDLYNLPSPSGSGVVNFVKIYIRIRSLIEAGWRKTALKIDGSVYETGELTINNENWYTTFNTWNTNPKTSAAWTFAELADLQIGINLKAYTNPLGSVQVAEVWLYIDYTPGVVAPTVTTLAATNIQAATARLNGQISNDGGEACQYRFRYKKSGGAYSYTTWTGAKTTGQTFYENISGLDKKSLYYFNAQAKNSAGVSDWGGELSFTTLATTPVVTTQAVSDIGPTTATGHGNITDIGGENCTKRGVCWNTTGNPTVADSKSEETDSFGTGAFERAMTGLTPGQLYYVRAYAYNSAGYGYGGQVEFTTKTYYATGYIGDVIDCTELVKTYDRLEWTEEIPSPEQAIEIKIRSSPDLSTWTDWEVIYSSPCTSFGTPVQRYLEWVATLTTDQSDTPKLKDLGFFWTKKVE